MTSKQTLRQIESETLKRIHTLPRAADATAGKPDPMSDILIIRDRLAETMADTTAQQAQTQMQTMTLAARVEQEKIQGELLEAQANRIENELRLEEARAARKGNQGEESSMMIQLLMQQIQDAKAEAAETRAALREMTAERQRTESDGQIAEVLRATQAQIAGLESRIEALAGPRRDDGPEAELKRVLSLKELMEALMPQPAPVGADVQLLSLQHKIQLDNRRVDHELTLAEREFEAKQALRARELEIEEQRVGNLGRTLDQLAPHLDAILDGFMKEREATPQAQMMTPPSLPMPQPALPPQVWPVNCPQCGTAFYAHESQNAATCPNPACLVTIALQNVPEPQPAMPDQLPPDDPLPANDLPQEGPPMPEFAVLAMSGGETPEPVYASVR